VPPQKYQFEQHSVKALLKYFLSFYCAALAAFSGSAEKFGAAIIAGKKFFFSFNKRLSTQLSPERNGTQNIFLSLRHREIFYLVTREISALMAAGISLFPGTTFNWANFTIPVNRIGEASPAINFVGSIAIGFGQFFF
jgi:hypothetical protein